MKRVYYNKLIRDNIPAKIQAKAEQCEVRQISDIQELQQELLKKVREEAESVSSARTKEEFLEEYCDLKVVLDELLRQLDITDEEFVTAQQHNLKKKGGYKKAYFLHWSEDAGYHSNESVQGIVK